MAWQLDWHPGPALGAASSSLAGGSSGRPGCPNSAGGGWRPSGLSRKSASAVAEELRAAGACLCREEEVALRLFLQADSISEFITWRRAMPECGCWPKASGRLGEREEQHFGVTPFLWHWRGKPPSATLAFWKFKSIASSHVNDNACKL